MPANTRSLLDIDQATVFYNSRYATGYMDEWPEERKARVRELLGEMQLPATGTALDFGCGSGVFTEVLSKALPVGWEVYGCDISVEAIAQARQRHPTLNFFVFGGGGETNFDLIFSNHVLEHVSDLQATVSSIRALAKAQKCCTSCRVATISASRRNYAACIQMASTPR